MMLSIAGHPCHRRKMLMLFNVWRKILLDTQHSCGHIELCVSWKLALFHVFGLCGVTLTVLLTGGGDSSFCIFCQ